MNTEKAFLMLGIVIALITLLFGVIFIYYQNQLQYTPKNRKYNRGNIKRKNHFNAGAISIKASSGRVDNQVSMEQVPKQLQKRLLILLNSDRHAATRLLTLAKTRNPKATVDWCAEKVIFDLQRDHGRY